MAEDPIDPEHVNPEQPSMELPQQPDGLAPQPAMDWSAQIEGELQDETADDDQDMAHLLEGYDRLTPPAEGELIVGKVVSITANEVFVGFGYKLEGLVPIDQFRDLDGSIAVKVGDMVKVMADRGAPQQQGYVPLSYAKAAKFRIWDTLEKALNEQSPVNGRVVEVTKGGLTLDVGVEAFMPGSQVDVRPISNLEQFVGQIMPVKIVKINRRRGNVVVSRKLVVEQQQKALKGSVLEHIAEGDIVTGVVKNLTDYGAFIDLGGIDGLLHVSDLSHGRVTNPAQVLQVGQEVTAKVLRFDREKERISLGVRQMIPDPWESLVERLPPGSRVIGRVMSVTDYGAFVEIEAGVEGLIHVSEMTWSRRMKHPSKIAKPGDQVEAVVLEVKVKERRVSLGIKQLEADPWTTVADRYSIGSVVEGRIRKLTDFGVFMEIEEGVDGLVHLTDLTWSKKVKTPADVVKKGQVLQAVILNIDAPNRRLSLGVKQLQPDAWESFFRAHAVGDLVRGRVCRAAAFGMFVELAPGVEALCHKSEIPALPAGTQTPGVDAVWLPLGDEYDFKIVKMNEAGKKIGLSLRAIADDDERARLQDYQRQAAAATMTMEEAMQRGNSK
ncbi:MAG: 30S ribosomal protein S1 [Acidobacteriota bacterium]